MAEIKELLDSIAQIQNEIRELSQSVTQFSRSQGIELPANVKTSFGQTNVTLSTLKKLVSEEATHIQLLQDLIQSSALINSSLELDQVLENLMDTITKITGAERSYLLILDESDGKFKTRTARNWDQESISESEISYSMSVIETAVEIGQPIVTDNAQTDTRFNDSLSVTIKNLRSIICIPLQLHGKTIGVLYADNRLKPGAFKAQLVPLLAAFATQAGIAIQNARQFEKAKDELAQANLEVRNLKILLNQAKINEEVSAIAESEYFQRLQQTVDEIRAEFDLDN